MSLFPKFKIDPKTPATPATFQPKCSESSNCSNPLEMDSGISGVSEDNFSQTSDRGKSIQEATRLYRKRGWIQVYSTYLKANIYLVRNKAIHVPDPSILRYAESEIDALRDLSLEELKTLHEAKIIFKGVINERREQSTEQSAFPVWR